MEGTESDDVLAVRECLRLMHRKTEASLEILLPWVALELDWAMIGTVLHQELCE